MKDWSSFYRSSENNSESRRCVSIFGSRSILLQDETFGLIKAHLTHPHQGDRVMVRLFDFLRTGLQNLIFSVSEDDPKRIRTLASHCSGQSRRIDNDMF